MRTLLTALLLGASVCASAQSIDRTQAAQYFREAKELSQSDGSKLWGVPICGPILFGAYSNTELVANQSDKEGHLKADGEVFSGERPANMGIANTTTDFGGVHWTMLAWPLPQYLQERRRLLAHECFHHVQDKLGIPLASQAALHLDTMNGCIWLQLEWRALQKALRSNEPGRTAALTDALAFRAYRQSLFPSAQTTEPALELGEGTAEYTGVKLAAYDAADALFLAEAGLRSGAAKPTFSRSFAYASGPAYGLLLDTKLPAWRKSLKAKSDLAELAAKAYEVAAPKPDEVSARRRAKAYDGEDLIAVETRREQQRLAKVAALTKLLIDGPVVMLPVGADFSYTFDPNAVFAIDDDHIVYSGAHVSDTWGNLDADDGSILFVRENGKFTRVQVAKPANAPSASKLKGDGWELKLKEGWILQPGSRTGDITTVSKVTK